MDAGLGIQEAGSRGLGGASVPVHTQIRLANRPGAVELVEERQRLLARAHHGARAHWTHMSLGHPLYTFARLHLAGVGQAAQRHLHQVVPQRLLVASTGGCLQQDAAARAVGGHVEKRLQCDLVTAGGQLSQSLWCQQQCAVLLGAVQGCRRCTQKAQQRRSIPGLAQEGQEGDHVVAAREVGIRQQGTQRRKAFRTHLGQRDLLGHAVKIGGQRGTPHSLSLIGRGWKARNQRQKKRQSCDTEQVAHACCLP